MPRSNLPLSTPSPSYHALAGEEVLRFFQGNLETGLSAEAVAECYKTYGWNELTLKPGKPAWLRVLLEFNQPLLYILLRAGGIKAFLGSWTNASVIWGVTVPNAVIGYVQEAAPPPRSCNSL